MLVAGGSTNVTTYFAMRLTANGKAATGLTIADFDLQYVRSGAAPAAKVDATALAATDSAHADNKAIEIDATDQPGLYRVDWPDAAFAAGVRETILTVKVATAFTEHKSAEIDQIAPPVWDRILTGATHNIASSAGRRLRIIQESGSYQGGAVWIDTVNGTAGTTDFENGVDILPVDSIADANTIVASIGLSRFEVAPGSAITFPGAQTNEVWNGRDWTLALASRDITGSFIFGAIVSGIGTATAAYELEECDIGAVTLDNDCHIELCALTGTFTIGQAGTFTFHACFTESASAITIDFAAVGATAVHLFDFNGEINFKNMAAGDAVHITGAGTITTETCTAGTIEHDGFFEYTDAGGNVTEVQSDIKVAVDSILVDTGTTLDGRIPAALVSGRMDASVGAMAANVLTAAAIASGALSQSKFGSSFIQSSSFAAGAINAAAIASNAITAVKIATDAITAAKIAADAIGASELAADAVAEIADGVLDEALAGHVAAGSLGKAISDTEADAAATLADTGTDGVIVVTNNDKTGYSLTADFAVKKNTALANFPFLMVDATDGITPETGLTVTAQRSIDGAAFANCANSVVEVANGVYKINLAASDLNGATIMLRFTAAGAADALVTIITQTE